ncbi:MAG: acyltransferase [Bacteroidota bacterium]|nr:acyltransferase [Bacteroidota bacterium]
MHEGGRIQIGAGVQILQDSWLIVECKDEMDIGENVFISQHCTVSGSVRIGKDTLIAGFVSIIDAHHTFKSTDIPIREQGGVKRPICIGKDVWIGTMSVVLAGVTIGDGAVIGANTTVTHDIPPRAIAVGCPARIVGWRGGT